MSKKKFIKKGNHKRFIPGFLIVYTDNAQALYVNGELYTQKRRITERDIALALNMMYVHVDKKWMSKRDYLFPGRWVDIPLKSLT